MASFDYNGNTYFNVGGRWLDHQSRPVPADIATELDNLYSKKDVKTKETDQKRKQKTADYFGRGVKRYNHFSYGDYYSKSFPTINTKRNHQKAKSFPYHSHSELTNEQKRALALLESGENIFLSGEAGTGKSFVLNEFVCRNRSKNMIICAPTGIAAINIGGSTLHRTFKIPIGIHRPGEYNTMPDDSIVEADIIIIDEISMCRIDLFEYVIRSIWQAEKDQKEKRRREALSNGKAPSACKPKQIIVVGDFCQLAPVITATDMQILETCWGGQFGEGFAFQSKLWEKLNFKNIILKEIIRQKGDDDYINNLNLIRIGNSKGITWFNQHIKKEPLPNSIFLCATNREADAINSKESDALLEKSMTYNAVIKGQVDKGDKLTLDSLTLKIGMQVMTLVNEPDGNYQNGSIGKVYELNTDSVLVELNNGRLVYVKPHEWEIFGYEMQQNKLEKVVIGTFKQMPLKIAYAITIHKSQGQTYSSVNISPDCFAAGQLYVALSRAQTVERMSLLHDITESSLRTSRMVQRFYSELQETL